MEYENNNIIFKNNLTQSIPSEEENIELIKNAINGTEEDKWNLIIKNIKFVYHIAKKHILKHEDMNDFVSDGLIGFKQGVDKLKPCNTKQFRVYCGWHIEQSMVYNANKRRKIIGGANNKKTTNITVSLDSTPQYYNTIGENLYDNTNLTPYEECELNDNKEFSKCLLNDFKNSKSANLTKAEYNVLTLMIKNNLNNTYAAKERNVSKQCIDQIMTKVERKLYNYLARRCGYLRLNEIYGSKIKHSKRKLNILDRHGRPTFKHFLNELYNNFEKNKKSATIERELFYTNYNKKVCSY